jgi:hypothetical protein
MPDLFPMRPNVCLAVVLLSLGPAADLAGKCLLP